MSLILDVTIPEETKQKFKEDVKRIYSTDDATAELIFNQVLTSTSDGTAVRKKIVSQAYLYAGLAKTPAEESAIAKGKRLLTDTIEFTLQEIISANQSNKYAALIKNGETDTLKFSVDSQSLAAAKSVTEIDSRVLLPSQNTLIVNKIFKDLFTSLPEERKTAATKEALKRKTEELYKEVFNQKNADSSLFTLGQVGTEAQNKAKEYIDKQLLIPFPDPFPNIPTPPATPATPGPALPTAGQKATPVPQPGRETAPRFGPKPIIFPEKDLPLDYLIPVSGLTPAVGKLENEDVDKILVLTEATDFYGPPAPKSPTPASGKPGVEGSLIDSGKKEQMINISDDSTRGEPAPGSPAYTPSLTPSAGSKPTAAGTRMAVGGNSEFVIRVAGSRSANDSLKVELAPARASFFERQGQRVPGAGAGLEIRTKANIAKLNVPGSRPIYQHMGIAEECLEFVGAFVGFDHWLEKKENGNERKYNAWEESAMLAKLFSKGQELEIVLNWHKDKTDSEKGTHKLMFEYGEEKAAAFKGYIKEMKRSYATAQRVYYHVVFCVTNRNDVETETVAQGKPITLPSDLTTLSTLAGGAVSVTASNPPENDTGGSAPSSDPNISTQSIKNTDNNNDSLEKQCLDAFTRGEDPTIEQMEATFGKENEGNYQLIKDYMPLIIFSDLSRYDKNARFKTLLVRGKNINIREFMAYLESTTQIVLNSKLPSKEAVSSKALSIRSLILEFSKSKLTPVFYEKGGEYDILFSGTVIRTQSSFVSLINKDLYKQ